MEIKDVITSCKRVEIPNEFYENKEAYRKVEILKRHLADNGCSYLGGGSCASVLVNSNKKYVVKICDIYAAERITYSCYEDGGIIFTNSYTEEPFISLQNITIEHILPMYYVSKDGYMAIQRYLPQNEDSAKKVKNYFNELVGDIYVENWRRHADWTWFNHLNNLAWDEENKKAWIIDYF